MTSAVKALLFILVLVLLPTVPITVAVARALRRGRDEPDDMTTGRAASTPFRLISIVGSGIAAAAFVALVVVLVAQSFTRDDEGESVAPVENGGAGTPPTVTAGSVPTEGNAEAGRKVFARAGCGDCHALAAANAGGTTGPSLDEDRPDFTTVVECVTTGPGDMPSYAGRLSSAEIRDVAKYVAVSTLR